jgi:hypothetical protein
MANHGRLSRRSVISGSAALVAGAAGATVVSANAASASAPAGPSGRAHIARVTRSFGSTAEVEVLSPAGSVIANRVAPVTGFPEGWQLQPGDRVILSGTLDRSSPATIMPLVEPIRGRLEGSAGPSARIAGRAVTVRPGAVDLRSAPQEDSIAFCVRNDVSGDLSCVSVKPVSAFATLPQTS